METSERPETNLPPAAPAAGPSTHILAIASLILSILGLLPVLPLVGSIAGIVTGNMARREILARPDLHTGEATARAGVILGWVGLALWLLGACLVIAALIFILPVRVSNGGIIPGPVISVVPVTPIP